MAKAPASSGPIRKEKPKVTRPGIHSKKKQSSNKTSKNYTKPYAGQGH